MFWYYIIIILPPSFLFTERVVQFSEMAGHWPGMTRTSRRLEMGINLGIYLTT